MERYCAGFRVFGAGIPLHPSRQVSGCAVRQQPLRDQPVFVLLDVVFQELVSDDDVLADELIELLDLVAGKFSIMSDDFQGKVESSGTGFALTIAVLLVGNKIP